MIRYQKILTLAVCLAWASQPICAQSGTGSSNDRIPFTINGYISSQLSANSTSGIARRIDPINYRLNGVFSIRSYGLRANMNINIADKRQIYSLDLPKINIPSYTLIGISPSYKWATLHLGFRSMHFSDYSMSGHSYYGTGLELNPGNFRFSSFYGRLKRASAETINLRQSLDSSYKRMAWGLKIGYEVNQENIAISLFSANDVEDSLVNENEPSSYPQANAVVGITATKKIGSVLNLDIDYAFSALTRDNTAQKVEAANSTLNPIQEVFGIFNPKISSEYRKALKTMLTFKTSSGNIRMTHERVDPGYRSLGALFFNNDYENITGGGQFRMKENKIMLSINGGFQRNNISGKESNKLNRLIGSANLVFNHSDRTSFNLSYSNFKTTNTLYSTTIPIIQVDSITLSLVNRQFSLSISQTLGKNRESNLNGMISYNRSNAIQNDIILESQTNKNLMAHIVFFRKFTESNLIISGSLLMNKNNNEIINLLSISPTIGISKGLYNNSLLVKGALSFANIYVGGEIQRRIIQPRINLSYRVNKKQSLNIIGYLTSQHALSGTISGFKEFSSRVSWKVRL